MATALLFPGQGSQTPEMREQVARVRPDLLKLAIEVVGDDPFLRVDDGTAYAQPAIFCASIAGWCQLGRPLHEFTAGHSLGELGALVAAGVLTNAPGWSWRAARPTDAGGRGERGDGGMIALCGAEAAERADEVAAPHGLSIANDNSPQQVVLSVRERCCRRLRRRRANWAWAKILPVTGAFQLPMMASAVPDSSGLLIEWSSARHSTVISAVTAEPFDDVRARLVQALTGPALA